MQIYSFSEWMLSVEVGSVFPTEIFSLLCAQHFDFVLIFGCANECLAFFFRDLSFRTSKKDYVITHNLSNCWIIQKKILLFIVCLIHSLWNPPNHFNGCFFCFVRHNDPIMQWYGAFKSDAIEADLQTDIQSALFKLRDRTNLMADE